MQAPTNKVIAGSVVATIAAPLSLIVVYLINGFGFGCWGDPTATAVACKTVLPNTISAAITAVFTGILTLAAGYAVPEGGQGGGKP